MNKAMYGLKQEPKTWYDRIDSFLSSLGFTKSKADSNLYYKVEDGNLVMLLLYVDDLFVTGMDGLIADTKRNLAIEFEMKDLGYDALLSRNGSVAEYGWNLPWRREVCSRDPEEVWDDGYGHTYCFEPEAIV